ncbi:MAG: hypothetical protein IJO94_02905, partial [Firmicutes bacterium]|nr:hypothetical protein [Bacillota bacterium]
MKNFPSKDKLMNPNRLTPEEKQMPVIRLPLRIAVFAWIGIFLGVVGTSAAAAMGEKLFIAIFGGILLFSLGWQAIYLRHCLFFNKNKFIFRNKFGKIQHYVYEDITYIDENRDSLLLNIRGCKIRIDKSAKTAKEFLTTALDKNTEKKCYGISGKEFTALNVDPQFILLSIIIQAALIFFFLLIIHDVPSGPLEIYLNQTLSRGAFWDYLSYLGYGIFIFGILYAYWLILIYFRCRIVYNETEIITFDFWGRKEYFRFSDVTAAEETYTDENGISSTPSVFYFGNRKLKFSYYLKTTEVQEAETQDRLARIANEKASSKESPKNTIPQNEEKTDESEDYFFAFQVFAVLIFIIFITSWFLMRIALQEQYLFIATLLLSAAGVTALIDLLFLTIRKFPYRFPLFLLKPYIRWINPSAEFFEELSPKQ